MSDVLQKLWKSLFSTDIYIFVFFMFELGVFLFALLIARSNAVSFEKKKLNMRDRKKKISNSLLVVPYNLFTNGISVFPLLGMFGTVAGLLGLDLIGGDMGNIRNNFFMALTSTAWGIIFSVFFKFIYAISEDYFEKKVKESTELMEECNRIFERGNW